MAAPFEDGLASPKQKTKCVMSTRTVDAVVPTSAPLLLSRAEVRLFEAEELIDNILQNFCPRFDDEGTEHRSKIAMLQTISRTNKTLWRIAKPLLWQNPRLELFSGRPGMLFIRSLMEDAHLRGYCKSLIVSSSHEQAAKMLRNGVLEYSTTLWNQCRHIVRSQPEGHSRITLEALKPVDQGQMAGPLDIDGHRRIRELRTRAVDAEVVVILMLCSNASYLEIYSDHVMSGHDMFAWEFLECYMRQIHLLLPMRRRSYALKHIRYIGGLVRPDAVRGLRVAPGVAQLMGGQLPIIISNDGDQLPLYFRPFLGDSYYFKLQYLKLTNVDLMSMNLDTFIKAHPCLHSMYISAAPYEVSDVLAWSWKVEQLAGSIVRCQDLEYLVLDLWPNLHVTRMSVALLWTIGQLSKLKGLRLPVSAYYRRDGAVDSEHWYRDGTESRPNPLLTIPLSLERLELFDGDLSVESWLAATHCYKLLTDDDRPSMLSARIFCTLTGPQPINVSTVGPGLERLWLPNGARECDGLELSRSSDGKLRLHTIIPSNQGDRAPYDHIL